MNRNYFIGLAITAAVLGLAAFIVWSVFEIVPDVNQVLPSRDARANEYLALDRWLKTMGISVKIENAGNLSTIINSKEKQIFIQASLFDWNSEAAKYLTHWVEEGGHLFLALDNNWWEYAEQIYDDNVLLLLENFGIALAEQVPVYDQGWPYDPNIPSFSSEISFEFLSDDNLCDDAWALKDEAGNIRLVRGQRGKGSFCVSGPPLFLYSQYLGDEPNSRLAWALFAGINSDGKNESVLFIRGKAKVRGIFGSLWQQGNLAVLLVSVLVLAAIGFWAVIPGFGLVRGDDEISGKPLRERFLAEGRFLKRYGALELYRDTYLKEIKRQLMRREGSSNEQCERILNTERIPNERFTYREFPKLITTLKTILDRLKYS
jgi:hypothetical protein